MQKKIDTSKAPGALGPYSQAVEIEIWSILPASWAFAPRAAS